MTKEQKDLLKKVICAMSPYGVKATTTSNGWNGIYTITGYKDDRIYLDCPMYDEGDDEWLVESVKPYLRPMSSMTEEERNELENICVINYNEFEGGSTLFDDIGFDWLNAHHFDYRGLIPLGLAIAVTEENNPYKD